MSNEALNGYVCFWKGKKVEVHASSTYAAQLKAQSEFEKMSGKKKVHSYDIEVVLAEKDDKAVTHKPMF
jgi:hypothetical protein